MTVTFVFNDTIILTGKSDPKNMYLSPHGPDSQHVENNEWVWTDQTLAEYSKPGSGVGWIFVAGHYPGMHSYSHYGFLAQIILILALRPMSSLLLLVAKVHQCLAQLKNCSYE